MNARLEPAILDVEPQVDFGVLRFITAGSVDDGKSTLIGRLLYDTRSVLSDQLDAVARAGRHRSSTSNAADAAVDLSLLTDGLEAEREQGITIDVAYRYFATARRKFIIADTPGHEQYTRNMVTGASTADAAVILIDATRLAPDSDGQVQLLPQTRRHAALVHLLGLRHVVVAVNKMDAVGFSSDVFESIVAAFGRLAKSLGLGDVTAIPMSALTGDNVVRRTNQMPWYRGPVLLDWLESVDIGPAGDSAADTSNPLRFAVQWVQKRGARADAGARAYLGRVGSGTVRSGQKIHILPSGARARVAAIETFDGDLASAVAGKSVAIRLDREVDVSRGDWLVAVDEPSQPRLARRVHADLAWLDAAPLEPKRKFLVRHGTRLTWARIVEIEALLDLHAIRWREANDLRTTAATLGPNDIARVVLEVQQPLPFDPYDRSVVSGAVVLIDATTNHTLAAGMLRAAVDA